MASTNSDDDYSPDVAVRLFPSIVVPRVIVESEDSLQNAMDFDHLLPVDPSDLDLNSSAKTLFNYTFAPNGTWIFGPGEDGVILPLILSVIGITDVIGNALVLASFFVFRRMRSGQNAMLVNVSIADLSFVVLAVPVAIVNHAVPPTEDVFVLGAGLCSFVHYTVFVCFYVAVYTLVVVCVFRFFGEMMMMTRNGSGGGRGGGRGECAGSPTIIGGGVHLSVCNASVSCVVIWIAFLTSHLNFVVNREGAIYQQPFICRHTAADSQGAMDPTKLRTLWVTFLACAFLFPLVVVCALSAGVLHRQRLRRSGAEELPYETAQNSVNDRQSKRQLTLLIMAATVARSLCWLPVQVYLLVDAFGGGGGGGSHGRMEMVGVCFALLGASVNPPIYFWVSDEFRGSFRQILWRMGCRWCGGGGKEGRSAAAASCPPGELKRCRATGGGGGGGGGQGTDLNETIMSIISDSSNHINYA